MPIPKQHSVTAGATADWKLWRPGYRYAGRKTRPKTETFTQIFVNDVWIEQDVGPWRVACRVSLSQGRVVISEVRVFPAEDRRPYGRGHWSAEGLGIFAPVPAGGLNSRLLRQMSIGSHLLLARTLPPDDVRQLPARGWLFPKQKPARRNKPGTRQRRGRPQLPDAVYQKLLRQYDQLIGAGDKSPCVTLARRWRWSHSRVRSAIHRANKRGITSR